MTTLQGYESEAVTARNAAQVASNLVGGASIEAIASYDVDFASAYPNVDAAHDSLGVLKTQCQEQLTIAGTHQDTQAREAALARAQAACD